MRSWWMAALGLLLSRGITAPPGSDELLPNGGFEEGTSGWRLVLGGYGEGEAAWDRGREHARLVDDPVHRGGRALLLSAVGLEREVDVYSDPVPVRPNYAYLLQSFVRQFEGTGGYKVTLDWQTLAGEHLRYDNDWRGYNRPTDFEGHGGVFVAPPEAGRVVLILGVAPGVRCAFDDLSLRELGETELLASRPRRDGDGRMEIEGPAEVEAGGFATWRAVYTCGESGLPVGGAIVLRRWPVSFEGSPPQGARPQEAGYVSARGPREALFSVEAGRVQEVVVRLQWPALQPGEQVEIAVGDARSGGPGLQMPGKVGLVRWIAASDCDADGQYRDLSQTTGGHFAIMPGPAAKPWVVAPALGQLGERSEIRLEVRDAAGNPTDRFEGRCLLSCLPPEPDLPAVIEFRRGELAVRSVPVAWSQPGLHRFLAHMEADDGVGQDQAGPAWVFVSRRLALPDAASFPGVRVEVSDSGAMLANGQIALVMARNPGAEIWGAGLLLRRTDQGWRPVAALPGVGRETFAGGPYDSDAPPAGALFFAEGAAARQDGGAAELVLEGRLRPNGADFWPFTAVYRLEPDALRLQFRLVVEVASPAPLAALQAPLVYAGDGTFGEGKAGALFPGLEFLTAEEVSSDDHGVAWPLRERGIPHPYKITVPLMAVAGDGAVVGLTWDPLQQWDGARAAPLALFASPNRQEDKPNHLMALLLPGLTEGFEENRPGAAHDWKPPVGSRLCLSADLFVLSGTEDVAQAVRYWARVHPLPEPEPPRPWQEGLWLSAQGFTGTAWNAQAKGWISAVGWEPGAHPDIGDRLLEIAALGPPGTLRRTIEEQVGTAFPAPRGAPMQLRRGDAEQAIAELRGRAYEAMASQHPDGYWTFGQVYATDDLKASLAQPDDVELGTCVNLLEGILDYAVATGDPRAVEAGLRGLAFIERFTKPAGSESWEVPLVNPNLRAAALASRCFLRGWQLTGREEYLERARRWAWAGAAFIYLWRAPDRPAMPGASISVMGTTFYTHPWFGAAVQWVGLFYAEVLRELARFDDSFDWSRLAALITASALHQQKGEGARCGHVGFYPDSYSLVRGEDYYEWCLAPTGIVNNLLEQMGFPHGLNVAALPAGGERVHLFSVARLAGWDWEPAVRRLRLRLAYYPGLTSQLVLFGLQEPQRVLWNGAPLRPLETREGEQPGWFMGATENALIVRLDGQDREGELILEGARLTGYRPPQLPDRIPNGGFEQGADGWQLEPQAYIERRNPYRGEAALVITAPNPGREGQAVSAAMRVEGSRRYRLRAWVWQPEGDGDYKVTLDWLDEAGRHLAYANDWQGTDRPRQWREHGGVFESPPQAARARVILGCRGATCWFDEVELKVADDRDR